MKARTDSVFGATVIAEGVESKEVVDALRHFGVELMPGYFFARPLSADAAAEFMLLH